MTPSPVAAVLIVEAGEVEGGIFLRGSQLAKDLTLAPGSRFGLQRSAVAKQANGGFLICGRRARFHRQCPERTAPRQRKVRSSPHEYAPRQARSCHEPSGLSLAEGDISNPPQSIEYQVKQADIVLPLRRNCHPRRNTSVIRCVFSISTSKRTCASSATA